MQETDTKTRILDAAERLFAAKGLEGVSLRAVTTEAGVNLAAVNYHFGSKEALLGAMVRRFFAAVHTGQSHALDALEAAGGAPSVAQLLVAYATPVFTLFDAYRGRDWGRVWMLARSTEGMGRGMYGMQQLEGSETVTRRYLDALGRAVPHLSPEERAWRFERASNLLVANQGRSASAPPAAPARGMEQDERAWLITFLVSALSAPATDTGPT